MKLVNISRRRVSSRIRNFPRPDNRNLLKDMLLLVLGSIIGIASGIVGGYIQGKYQLDQFIFSKQIEEIREVTLKFNEFCLKHSQAIEEVRDAFDSVGNLMQGAQTFDFELRGKFDKKMDDLEDSMKRLRGIQFDGDLTVGRMSVMLGGLLYSSGDKIDFNDDGYIPIDGETAAMQKALSEAEEKIDKAVDIEEAKKIFAELIHVVRSWSDGRAKKMVVARGKFNTDMANVLRALRLGHPLDLQSEQN
jgi:hypothetical protein